MRKGKTVRGLKLLREDWSSLNNEYDRIHYGKKWQEIPGNGAYVAESAGIDSGGRGPVLALMECRDRLGDGPLGVGRFRFVRLIRAVPSEKPLKAYDETIAPAEKAYDETIAPAKKAYDETIATAKKAYDETIAPAEKAYDETIATAKKAYYETIATAFRKVLMAAVAAPRKGKRARR